MDKLVIQGGTQLNGEIRIAGAKNSALKLMAASILAPGTTVVRNVPRIRDCGVMVEILENVRGRDVGSFVAEAQRRVLLESRLLMVEGKLESENGVRHVIARRLHDLTPMLGSLDARSRDFR